MWVLIPGAVGAIIGIIGWYATEFLARPLRRFFDLRGEVKRRMLFCWNAPLAHTVIRDGYSDAEAEKLQEGRHQLEDIGAQIASLENAEFLVGVVIRRMGYDPTGASKALRAAAIELGTDIEDRDKNFSRVDKALKFYVDEGRPFYDPYNQPRRPPHSK